MENFNDDAVRLLDDGRYYVDAIRSAKYGDDVAPCYLCVQRPAGWNVSGGDPCLGFICGKPDKTWEVRLYVSMADECCDESILIDVFDQRIDAIVGLWQHRQEAVIPQ